MAGGGQKSGTAATAKNRLGRTAPQPVGGVLSRATHKASVAAVGALVRRGDSPTPIEATGIPPADERGSGSAHRR